MARRRTLIPGIASNAILAFLRPISTDCGTDGDTAARTPRFSAGQIGSFGHLALKSNLPRPPIEFASYAGGSAKFNLVSDFTSIGGKPGRKRPLEATDATAPILSGH